MGNPHAARRVLENGKNCMQADDAGRISSNSLSFHATMQVIACSYKRYWLGNQTFSTDEAVLRFHRQLTKLLIVPVFERFSGYSRSKRRSHRHYCRQLPSVLSFILASATVCHCMFEGASAPPHSSGLT